MKILFNVPLASLTATDKEEFNFLCADTKKYIEDNFEVIWNNKKEHFTKEELKEKIKDVDAVVTHWGSPKIDKDVLENANKLKIVAHLAGTVNAYVSEEVYDKGIKVISANDLYFARSVAEGTIAYALVSLRRIDKHILNLHHKRIDGWYDAAKMTDIRGLLNRTFGIVSYGAISKHLASMLQVFGCKIKVYSRSISEEELHKYNMERVSLEELFSTCDIISVHTAYNEHTRHFIDKKYLRLIKDDALFINTSRGAVIKEEDLIEELSKGRFYAALDVFEEEPLPSDSRFYDMDNVLVIPHKGGPTKDMYRHLTTGILGEMVDFLLNGKEPDSLISKDRAFSMSFN